MSLHDPGVVLVKPEGRVRLPAALGIVFLMWAMYTALQMLYLATGLNGAVVAVLEFIPGVLAVAALRWAGFSPANLFLRPAWPSWKGLLALGAFSLVWPVILSTGQFIGWNWREALTQGATGVSQELFFRAALLPALVFLLKNRPRLALGLHTVLFAIWHGGAFLLTPPEMIAGPILITFMSLIAGLVWGGQTLHDRTVVWAMVHHSLLWVIGSMFYLGPPPG